MRQKIKNITVWFLAVIFTLNLIKIFDSSIISIPTYVERPLVEDFYQQSDLFNKCDSLIYILYNGMNEAEAKRDTIAESDPQRETLSTLIQTYDNKIFKLIEEQREITKSINADYNKALKKYEFKVFFLRLSIILPFLLISIFLLVRYKKHRFAAFLWVFMIFMVYLFITQLIFYLPVYGEIWRYKLDLSVVYNRYL